MNRTGPAPFGYQRVIHGLAADPEEAVVRKKIFELFIETKKMQSVAETLNAEGHRTRTGTLFSTQTICRYLKNPIVLGTLGEVERIVEDDLWKKCQDILDEQKAKGGAKRASRHLFAGLLHCSCGHKMYVPSASKKYVCGDCRAKIITDDLEVVFIQQATGPLMGKATSPLFIQWENLSSEAKREIVEILCDRIEVNGNSVTIHFAEL